MENNVDSNTTFEAMAGYEIPIFLEKKIAEFLKCSEICKSSQEIKKVLIEIDLFQKENQDILGKPGIIHSEQKAEVLKEELYWELSNTKKILEMRSRIIEKGLQEFTSFSVGGSIGAGYLGYLMANQQLDKEQEVLFGSSAGSLFPTLYLLWKEAIRVNPKGTKAGIEGLLSYLPQNLGDKTMWSNGEELIGEFQKTGQTLIDLINQSRNETNKLPSIEKIQIGDVSKTLGIIASRKKEDGRYQEVVFSGNDNLMDAIIASSNPEVSILGLKVSVLTNSRNKFLNNIWHDGDHTDSNPVKYKDPLKTNHATQIISLPFLERQKNLERMGLSDDMTFSEMSNLWSKNHIDPFQVPSDVESLVIEPENKSGFSVMDQNSGWSKETMEYRARISYIQKLILGTKNAKTMILFIQETESINLHMDEKQKVISQFISYLQKYHYRRDMGEGIENELFDSYNLAHLINESGVITKDQKKQLITLLFYNNDGSISNQYIVSDILPAYLPDSIVPQNQRIKNLGNFAENISTRKAPINYLFTKITGRIDEGLQFKEWYKSIQKYIPDDFFEKFPHILKDQSGETEIGLILLAGNDPRIGNLMSDIVDIIVAKMETDGYGYTINSVFKDAILNLSNKLQDPLRKKLLDGYSKYINNEIVKTRKKLGDLEGMRIQ